MSLWFFALLQIVPTCIILFSSLGFISAECGRQDRRRHFNRFSSEVVIGDSQSDTDEDPTPGRLIKPKRTFYLAILRCLGAFIQIGLYAYLAVQKINDQSDTPNPEPPKTETMLFGRENNDEWPLWLPLMHGIVWSFRGKLQETDVWAMDGALRIKTVFQDYLEERQATVFVTMLHLFRFELAQQYLWALGWAGLSLVPPYVVFKLLSFAQDLSIYNRNEALFYVAALFVSLVLRAAVFQRGVHMSQRIATKAMGMVSGLVYEKLSLRKDMDPYNYDITDLMAVDVKRIGHGWRQSFYIMIYPTVFILATIQLFSFIGNSAWIGALSVIAWYPISAVSSYLFSGRFDVLSPKMSRSDALVSDFLANLKAIKFLGWEEILLGNVMKAREEERKFNSKTGQPVLALISVPLGGDLIHAFVMTTILAAYSLLFKVLLTPSNLFSTLILVDLLTNCINSLPAVIIAVKEMLSSVVRINDFLIDEENDHDTAIIRDREMARRANIPVIGFVNASFIWPVAKPPHLNEEYMYVEEPDDNYDGGDASARPSRRASKLSRRHTSRSNSNWIVRTLSLFGYSLPEQPAQSQLHNHYGVDNNTRNVSADDFVLKDLNLSFPPGHVSLVTGTRRSGKSALLLALIGEMTRTTGKIYLPRKDYYHGKQGYGSDVAYVSQDPWLEIGGNGSSKAGVTGRSTIRDTILFGSDMEEERYTLVLRACVLEDELKGLPHGDTTIIGDKNVVWSMSLKQRISLARAIYSDASHILMDDCLSYVDAKSRYYIWKNCILGPLAQNKTRIMVSNQFHIKGYLNDVDYVVGLDQGSVLGHGTVKEILSQGWIRQAPGSSSIPTTIIPGASVPANLSHLPPRTEHPQRIQSDTPAGNTSSQDPRASKNVNLPLNKMSSLSDYDDLDTTLSRETAAGFKVGWTAFSTYVFSLGNILFLLGAFTCLFLSQALFVVRIGWLGLWTENEAQEDGIPTQPRDHRSFQAFLEEGQPPRPKITHFDYIAIFAALGAVRALFVILNAFFLKSGASKGADRIYARLLQSVAAARLNVFEVNSEKAAASWPGDAGGLFSKGTINGLKDSFQKDLSGLDVKLAKEFWQFSADFLAMILTLVVMVLIIPIVSIPIILVLLLLSSVAMLGLSLSKEMHRMAIRADRMNKDQFKHTFRGLATIRGYGLERRAIKAGLAQSETYLKTTYFGACAERWLHWKVDLLGALIPFSCAVIVLRGIKELDPVLIGFVLYLSLQFSDKFLDTLLGYGRIRNRLQWALERTRRYICELNNTDNKEAPKVIPNKRPPAGWPHGGAVEYINYACIRSEGPQGATVANQSLNKAPAALATQAATTTVQSREAGPNAHSPSDPSLSNRTNTGISAVNTIASNVSHATTASLSSVATANLATKVPLPTPSSTFVDRSEAQDASAPMDQLACLDQTEATIPPVTQLDGPENSRYDAPLPALPPNAVNAPSPALTTSGTNISTTQTEGDDIGFGPVSCSIQPGERIAVVGQSKSGKSTFVHSLFRVWETAEEERIRAAHAKSPQVSVANSGSSTTVASTTNGVPKNKGKATHNLDVDLGVLKVDGLDIEQIGLGDLRSRFSYLSQRGTVFAGTVRFNLDPHGEHEDAELNDILKTCFLNERLKLDTELVTPATATLTTVTGPVSASVVLAQKRLSRLSVYKKKFFRRSRARVNKGKNKASSGGPKEPKNVTSAPATVSAASGRSLLAELQGGGGSNNLVDVEQRFTQSFEDGQQEDGPPESDTDDDDEDAEDDGRVDLDTNEKQLLSLARILVQRPNIVVMDGALSKVTDMTAQRIDQIMTRELKHATILTVGHRLDRIVSHHHRIIVLEHGKIVEIDTPLALLNKPKGVFRTICNPDGPNFSSLMSLAKKQQLP
ncbi:hypothetical protein BGX31_007435 [Mortierella sp. GBA43]|nr:hypothetical protein BGX31_007435 [Mortierella sp. GBA43]